MIQVGLCLGEQSRAEAPGSRVENRSQVHVLVAIGNRCLRRGNVVSCVYARPFDRMPVKFTHLHSSLEGVAPTEVLLSPRSEEQADLQ